MDQARRAVVRDQFGGVLVDEGDRTRLRAARGPGDRLALRLFGRQPERRDDRCVGAVVQSSERGVNTRHRARSVERPGQHLVEVDRAGELAEHLVPPSLFLGMLERLRQLADHGLHARVHVRNEVGQALVALDALPGAADEPEDNQQQGDRRRACGDGYDDSRRHTDHFFELIRPPTIPGPPPKPQPKRARSHCNSPRAA